MSKEYAAREDLGLLRREYQGALHMPPPVRARLLEALPELVPDLSARVNEPQCATELLAIVRAELNRRPLPFDNATLHLVNALHNIHDTSEVMSEKARLLLELANLSDEKIEPYRYLPNERGITPPRSIVRERAIVTLARSSLFLNDARVRRFLLSKAIVSDSSWEQRLLAFPTASLMGTDAEPEFGKPLLYAQLRQIRTHLFARPGVFGLDATLTLLTRVAAFADYYGAEGDVRSTLAEILANAGQFPLTLGVAGATRDLVVTAEQALQDLADGSKHRNWPPWPLPIPKHVTQLTIDAQGTDPTIVSWPPRFVAERQRLIRRELARTTWPEVRCWLIKQLALWTPRHDHDALLNALVTESDAQECALTVSFELEGVAALERAELARAFLEQPPLRFGRNPRVVAARHALVKHQDWLIQDSRLRNSVVEQGAREDASLLWSRHRDELSVNLLEARFEFQPVLEHALELALASPILADQERGRLLVRHWFDLLQVSVKAELDRDGYDIAATLLFWLAENGSLVGVDAEIRDLLAALPDRFATSREIASVLLELSRLKSLGTDLR